MLPLQYADETVGCHIGQYFGESRVRCRHIKVSETRFLLQAGDSLAYALVKPLTLRIECDTEGEDNIKNIEGRGVVKIPIGCRALTNKAVLSKPEPARLMVEKNTSLPLGRSIKVPAINQAPKTPIDLTLIPIKHRQAIWSAKKGGTKWGLVAAIVIGGTAALLLSWAASCFIILRVSSNLLRSPVNL